MWTSRNVVSKEYSTIECRYGRGGAGRGVHTELDDVTDGAHNQETDTDGLGDFEELLLVGCREEKVSSVHSANGLYWHDGAIARTLLAPVHELDTLLDELPWDVEDLLYLVGHGCYVEMELVCPSMEIGIPIDGSWA